MKDLTYIKVKEGKLWASDQTEPVEPNYGDCEMDASDLEMTGEELYKLRMKQWTEAMESFNQSFVEVGNPEFALRELEFQICQKPRAGKEFEDAVMGRFQKVEDGLYPTSGLQFELREEFDTESVKCSCRCHKAKNSDIKHVIACCDRGYVHTPYLKKVAILSLKQEQKEQEPDVEHPVKKWQRLMMEKQDQEAGVYFNGKPCQAGCNCASVEMFNNGQESLKRGYRCLLYGKKTSSIKERLFEQEQPSEEKGMDVLKIYRFQAKQIEDTFRLVQRVFECDKKESSVDRDVMQSWQMIKNVLEGKIDKHVPRT